MLHNGMDLSICWLINMDCRIHLCCTLLAFPPLSNYCWLNFHNLIYLFFQNSPFFQNYSINLQEPPLGDGSFSICRLVLFLFDIDQHQRSNDPNHHHHLHNWSSVFIVIFISCKQKCCWGISVFYAFFAGLG